MRILKTKRCCGLTAKKRKCHNHTYTDYCHVHKPQDIDESRMCPICFDLILENRRTISCGHDFHLDCITKWFRISVSTICPVCRKIEDRVNQDTLKNIQPSNRFNETTATYYTLESDDENEISSHTIDPRLLLTTNREYLADEYENVDFFFHLVNGYLSLSH